MITKTISDEIIKKAEGNTLGIKAGLCLITPDDNIYSGIDHARRALKTIGNDRNIHAVYYSLAIELEYQRRQFFIDHFDDALKNHYIQVYYHRIVNSQTQDFDHKNMFKSVDDILKKYHIPVSMITIEITEQDIAQASE